MLRRSKSQRHLDGRPILSLPAQTISYTPICLAGSELAVYGHLEVLTVKLLQRFGAFAAPPSAQSAIRLLRIVCISVFLLSGGMGCTPQLATLAQIYHDLVQAGSLPIPEPEGQDAQSTSQAVRLSQMTPSQAISTIAALDRDVAERQYHDRFHNPQHRGDMVMHANKTHRVHDRVRRFAVDALSKKIEDAQVQKPSVERPCTHLTDSLSFSSGSLA